MFRSAEKNSTTNSYKVKLQDWRNYGTLLQIADEDRVPPETFIRTFIDPYEVTKLPSP